MNNHQFIAFLILLLSSTICFSSERVSVRGIVIDEETMLPVSGLNIVLGYFNKKWFFSMSPDFVIVDKVESSKDGTFKFDGKIPERFVIAIDDDLCWKHTE